MKNLDAKTIPLKGRHIIEASAGTGKTYNITELYIRLLLEKQLLPSQILVMTFTKDATQEIIGRVEAKIRDVISDHKSGQKVLADDDYKHLKRSLLEVDEAVIFTIHGFCKKILSEQAFASGMEMDVSMEVDTSDILQKVVEDFFRKHINKNPTNFEYLKTYSLHTPEKFLDRDGLANVIKSNYQIVADKPISLDEFNIHKQQQLDIFRNNQNIVDEFLSKLGKGEPEGKRVEEYHRVLEWLELDDETSFPDDIAILTHGNKIKGAKVKPVFGGIKELKELQQEIKQRKAALFIQQSCLQIRENFKKAKEQKGVLDFDDLITKLCQSVKNSSDLVKALQKQYPVALIDEFQDTDAQQYEILDTIYPQSNRLPHSSLERGADRRGVVSATATPSYQRGIDELLLLMIGDPKQAIYGFRGGDIFTYLKAKDSCPAENQWSMDTNWRSTQEMIKAYNRLFYKEDYDEAGVIGKDIFSEGIDYQTVKASPSADSKKRDFGDGFKPINYFYYDVLDDKKGEIDTKLSAWTANEIVRLLNSKNVAENDIAILVENGTQAKAIQQALNNKGLNSVYLSQRDNVYNSHEAQEILAVMEGINELENSSLLKKALSTSLLGGTAEQFAEFLNDEDITTWDNQLEQAKQLRLNWHKYGFMSFIMQILHQTFNHRTDYKERIVTNILHLAELIKVAENKYKHPNQLIKWYRQQLKASATSEGELRLESDDSLIKIITIHGSKGLEYPVVFIPFASYMSTQKLKSKKFNKYYDDNLQQTVYKIDSSNTVKQAVEKEIIDELKRLFYVAVTRAEHRCYIGVAKYDKSEKSPLAQFLDYQQKEDDWKEKIQAITQNPVNQSLFININEAQNIKLKRVVSGAKSHDYNTLKANDIKSLKNDNWEMLSFSKLSKSKVQNTALEKENDEAEDAQVQEIKPKFDFRFTATKGADIGNILHNVLEHTDFSAGKVDKILLKEQVDRYKVVALEDFDNLKEWLEECLTAPISFIETKQYDINMSHSRHNTEALSFNDDIQYGLFDCDSDMLHFDKLSDRVQDDGRSLHGSSFDESFYLKDIPNSKTLKEAEFYFPVVNEKFYKINLIRILEEYREQAIDYNEFNNQKIFGMLHGFIDLIFEYEGKFFVADYKSNYLGDRLEDYNQQAMCEKNRSSFYDLQYLIYSVALSKYLEQNIQNYSYDKHFGGVYYFYLRGMRDGFGIYRARPSYRLINKLKALFAGGGNHV